MNAVARWDWSRRREADVWTGTFNDEPDLGNDPVSGKPAHDRTDLRASGISSIIGIFLAVRPQDQLVLCPDRMPALQTATADFQEESSKAVVSHPQG